MQFRNVFFILCICISIAGSQVTTGLLDNTIDSISPLPKGRSAKMSTDANRKPVFTNCDKYKPSVLEEQSAGTFVIKVTADDFDPKDAGGIVTYKIVKREGERAYFNIDSVSGNITTTQPFDRDEPIRQKEMYITVQATDNGRPPLADICSFKVTVTDINDNSPSFDQNEYEARVSEDLKPNSEVMRVFAYDIDDGENSRLFYYFADNTSKMMDYFRIDRETGVVYLKDVLIGKKDTKFTNVVKVMDGVNDPAHVKSSTAEISITVVSSDKQPPRFTKREPEGDITLPENFIDFSKKLIYIEAESNGDDPGVLFELIKGKTTQSNKDQTFLLIPDKDKNNSATISLVRPLDYETVTEYLLTVRIKNTVFMETTLNIPIKIDDVNDEVPTFLELLRGSVVENDREGAQAMQVRAIDKDGTAANNIVSYELEDHQDIFAIDKSTGIITSKVSFDREKQDVYHVKVMVYDNSPSALYTNSTEPNKNVQTFQISIEDQNDNNPVFTAPLYQFNNISELADKFSIVGEVKAVDKDTASLITYSIIGGNEEGAFLIENTTGRIRTAQVLDFEKVEEYELIVQAFDGIFEDTAKVKITILNVNDVEPVFYDFQKELHIQEEKLVPGCILNVSAYDPDIKDRHADQHIVFDLQKDMLNDLSITKDGCLQLLRPLDRDPPYGTPQRQVFIFALDNDGGTNSLRNSTELTIILEDINDNAPFLNVTEIVWYENQSPGLITKLSADDYDGPDNGPPFQFQLAENAPDDIRSKFEILQGDLFALVEFDREEKKYYDIPISITDSGIPRLTGTSILRVIIGDENDNKAQDGESAIFVYKYVNGPDTDIEVGRVFVEDLDDWDLPDKVFVQQNMFDLFSLSDSNKGMIYMKPNIEEGVYVVNYEVTESHEPTIETHTVKAVVNITVKVIIEEAVVKSGSIRMHGITKEEFIVKGEDGLSKKDLLHQHLSKILNTSMANVDVFTVLQSPNKNNSYFDVRFSAHGSPYYAPERLQNKVTEHQDKLENELGVEFVMININECMNETICGSFSSCTNMLDISREPAVVFTNKTSFVGVNAVVDPVCDAVVKPTIECFNGGVLTLESTCNCPPGFQGPHCEVLGMGFRGDGWAMYPTFEALNKTEIVLFVAPEADNGLIFYAGPLTAKQAQFSKEFISLELKDGTPLLKINVGQQTQEIPVTNKKVKNDGALHKIRIAYSHEDILLEVDDCGSSCSHWTELVPKGVLRLNGPLQLGGTKFLFGDEESKRIWQPSAPTSVKFNGCIRNLTYNKIFYNLGAPSDHFNSHPDCNYRVMQAVTFGIDSNFLVAILVCLAILIILLLAVVVHRRKQDNMNEKEFDDIRENIIDYGEDGGGECDTPYDLSVLRQPNVANEKLLMRDNPDIPADISGLIDNKKDTCDKDPDNLPYDDVRHYAYEGDGNSTGSLSSLASCTDEGDLKFNYLSSFGPRFRKLADMYGEDPSDEDSHDGGEESWC